MCRAQARSSCAAVCGEHTRKVRARELPGASRQYIARVHTLCRMGDNADAISLRPRCSQIYAQGSELRLLRRSLPLTSSSDPVQQHASRSAIKHGVRRADYIAAPRRRRGVSRFARETLHARGRHTSATQRNKASSLAARGGSTKAELCAEICTLTGARSLSLRRQFVLIFAAVTTVLRCATPCTSRSGLSVFC